MDYTENNLNRFMRKSKLPFSPSEIKCLMLQLLQCIKFLHDDCIIHRHLKTSNILLNDRGELTIHPRRAMKSEIHCVAPEILLGATQFSTATDMWSVGCVMAELILTEPLFDGKTEAYQIDKIFRMLGTPNETIWPGFSLLPRSNKVNFYKPKKLLRKKFPTIGLPVLSDAGFDLLNRFLTYDPNKRITVDAALNHEWFREVPLPKSKENMPVFPAQDDRGKEKKQWVTSSGDSSVEAQIY